MLIKYKDAAYNNKIEDLRNNGYTVNFVAFDYDDFIMEEGNPVPFIELQLPNGGKSYNDYSAIVAWSDYLENEDNPDVPTDFNRTHSGMPVPSSFTVQDGDTTVNCYYVIEDTATEGVVRFSFAATSQGPFSNEDFKYFVQSFGGLMFIEGDDTSFEPDVSLVVPNLEAFFAQVNGKENFQLNLTGKTKLLSLGDNENFSAYKCYKIIHKSNEFEVTDAIIDDTCYYVENNVFKLVEITKNIKVELNYYTPQEIAYLEAEKPEELIAAAKENINALKSAVTNSSFVCLNLKRDRVYPISESLPLKSNLHIEGNNATILAYGVNSDNIRTEMAIINNVNSCSISNVTFRNLIFKGTYPFCDDQGAPISDGETGYKGDQCIYSLSEHSLFKNFKFETVMFDGFKFAVHSTSTNETLPSESFDWLFNNCEFVNVETGFMLCWSQGISITNSHIDNSMCKDDKHHCVYIARGSSYITVDNCLLENSVGTGIVNSDASIASEHRKMHHNTFTNLQIRNCNIGIIIGSLSEHITIKNIVATNVGRAIKLINCTDVNIDNFNATGCFYYEYFRKNKVGETRWVNSPSEWNAISTLGFVQAKITNSFFSTGGAMFASGKSGLLPDDFDYRIVTSNLEFKDCVFVSTFSEYKLGSDRKTYNQPGASLGVHTEKADNLKEFYYYNVDFDNCQFYMNSENNEDSMIKLYGYEDHPSLFKFNNCLVAYRDGNGNAYHDKELLYDDTGMVIENQTVSMPKSYFISPFLGTHAYINNCSFYHNRDVCPGDSAEGFVKNSLIKYCTIENNNKYNQKFKVFDEYPGLDNEETN